jgi:hypothetical protein
VILVFVLCLVHDVACVSVLYISDCNEEWILVFVLCLVHIFACVSVLSITTITYRQYRDTGNIVYKTQNEEKHPFFTAITYRQYRDTGNIVYKTQNKDKYPFFITITYRQYRDTGNIDTMLPVSLYCL